MNYLITKSQLKILVEQKYLGNYPPITIEYIKERLIQDISEIVDIKKPHVKRRMFDLVNDYAEKLYSNFLFYLDSFSDDQGFAEIVNKLEYPE